MRWEVLSKNKKNIKNILLKNRGIKDAEAFFDPIHPQKIKIDSLGIKRIQVEKAIARIKKAKAKKEEVIIYGDYDADGICATAILWEALHEYGLDVLPYIPDRFSEGYGIKKSQISNLKSQNNNLKLIICVDNGIVANEAIGEAKNQGIDVIVIDHHAKGSKKLSTSYILHSTEVCASALAYFFIKELKIKNQKLKIASSLELACIGTIADQMPLIGVNRSIVKWGLKELQNSKRPGMQALFREAQVKEMGTYEVNYIIAPRLNAMGRLAHGLDSLRLLCTKSFAKAQELSKLLTKTNLERQEMVENALLCVMDKEYKNIENKVIVLAHKSYHEGVIGLMAGKIAEEFYRPAIVISRGEKISKASARSVPGFDIISAVRNLSHLIIEGGGHPMAAGFSIETKNITKFTEELNKIASKLLTDELLEKTLKIDCEISFSDIICDLYKVVKAFEPFGNSNFPPVFVARNVEVVDLRPVGQTGKHLKLKLRQDNNILDAIWFNANEGQTLKTKDLVNLAFSVEENAWNNQTSLQLKIKGIKST